MASIAPALIWYAAGHDYGEQSNGARVSGQRYRTLPGKRVPSDSPPHKDTLQNAGSSLAMMAHASMHGDFRSLISDVIPHGLVRICVRHVLRYPEYFLPLRIRLRPGLSLRMSGNSPRPSWTSNTRLGFRFAHDQAPGLSLSLKLARAVVTSSSLVDTVSCFIE